LLGDRSGNRRCYGFALGLFNVLEHPSIVEAARYYGRWFQILTALVQALDIAGIGPRRMASLS
jgi:hypothetical protein